MKFMILLTKTDITVLDQMLRDADEILQHYFECKNCAQL